MPGPTMIDPSTGLELTVLTPAPTMWSQDSVRGQMMEPSTPGATSGNGGNPFLQAIDTPPVSTPQTASAAEAVGIPVQGPVMGGGSGGGLRPSSLLDKVLFTAFGTPDSMLSPEEEKAAHQRRNDAADMSRSAAEDPGEAHMGIPNAGGKSLGESLDFLPTLMKMLGGLG